MHYSSVYDAKMVTVPSNHDLRQAARVLRRVVAITADLADDSPRDAQLRDRLELAADVLDAATDLPDSQ